MTPEEDEKVAAILKKGGSIIMHKNDLERLREATRAGNEPSIFKGVKVYADKLGGVMEGQPIAAIIGGPDCAFNFRNTFST